MYCLFVCLVPQQHTVQKLSSSVFPHFMCHHCSGCTGPAWSEFRWTGAVTTCRHTDTHVMCQPSTAGPTGGLPSLFAGDTPPVYTAPANAILWLDHVCGCCWEDVHMITDQAHTIPFSGGHAQFLQYVFSGFIEVGGVSPCVRKGVHVSVYLSVCVSVVFLFVCIVCVYICVLKRLIHACACGGPSADNVWRKGEERDHAGR